MCIVYGLFQALVVLSAKYDSSIRSEVYTTAASKVALRMRRAWHDVEWSLKAECPMVMLGVEVRQTGVILCRELNLINFTVGNRPTKST